MVACTTGTGAGVFELLQPADPLFKGKRFYSPVVFTVSKIFIDQ